tara:strand:+ start:493 stop:735 length:243 start_codon:yes stop_codon:yes gene_type:complete
VKHYKEERGRRLIMKTRLCNNLDCEFGDEPLTINDYRFYVTDDDGSTIVLCHYCYEEVTDQDEENKANEYDYIELNKGGN